MEQQIEEKPEKETEESKEEEKETEEEKSEDSFSLGLKPAEQMLTDMEEALDGLPSTNTKDIL